MGQERVLHSVERHDSLRVPSDSSDNSSHGTLPAKACQADPGHPGVAQAPVVSGADVADTRASGSAQTHRLHSRATSHRHRSPRPGRARADRMATMRAGLRAQGLGPAAVELVLRSRRQSTNRLYDLRWTAWFNFCEEHGIYPILPSVSQFAVFLTYLLSV